MLREKPMKLTRLFESEEKVLAAYLFGSYVRGIQTPQSDIDIAVLLSETPKNILEYYLHLTSRLAEALEGEIDLIILNTAPPLLKYHVIKHGKLIYSRSERARITFEARAQSEYLDFRRAMERYDECFMRKVLA